jgi:hypothetical protein
MSRFMVLIGATLVLGLAAFARLLTGVTFEGDLDLGIS